MSPGSLEVRVPDIGEFDEVEVVEVLVAPGDEVEKDSSLVTLESDKASMDVPAPVSGRVATVAVAVGDQVTEGDLLVALEPTSPEEEQASALTAPEPAPPQAPAQPARAAAEAARPALPEPGSATEAAGPEEASAPAPDRRSVREVGAPPLPPPVAPDPVAATDHPGDPHASPSVRRFARELGVDLARVRASGPHGRILREDVQAYTRQRLGGEKASTGVPVSTSEGQVEAGRFGEIERVPLSRIRKVSKEHLHRSWTSVPHVTQHELADVTELEAFRKGQKQEAELRGVKLTLLPFLMKACVATLRRFPRLNCSLATEGDALVYKRYYHLGVAVDTEDGLVVPVLREVDRKGVWDLATELAAASDRARAGKLGMDDVQGGTFTISSLGGIGGSFFTPIVNSPEVAILGVSRARLEPVWRDGGVVPRLLLPLSLSYDHRVVDGAEAARFVTHLSSLLGDIRQLLL